MTRMLRSVIVFAPPSSDGLAALAARVRDSMERNGFAIERVAAGEDVAAVGIVARTPMEGDDARE